MTPDLIMQIGQQALVVTAVLILIMLVPPLVVGLVISMFQAATQINEQTLSFIPKLLTVLLVTGIAGHWMLGYLINFTLRQFHNIPFLIG